MSQRWDNTVAGVQNWSIWGSSWPRIRSPLMKTLYDLKQGILQFVSSTLPPESTWAWPNCYWHIFPSAPVGLPFSPNFQLNLRGTLIDVQEKIPHKWGENPGRTTTPTPRTCSAESERNSTMASLWPSFVITCNVKSERGCLCRL